MAYIIGAALAIGVLQLGRIARFDRDRTFYPVALIVIASYYELFAAMAGPPSALWTEAAATSFFIALAFVGFQKNLWLVVAGMAAHGMFDAVHSLLIENAGVPVWWPAFCLGFDAAAAAYLAIDLAVFAPRRSSATHVPTHT